jgi:hypothetical protein
MRTKIPNFFLNRQLNKERKQLCIASFQNRSDILAEKGCKAPYFPSSETVSFFLPLALRAASILRPLAEDMRSIKPCLFFLFLFEG